MRQPHLLTREYFIPPCHPSEAHIPSTLDIQARSARLLRDPEALELSLGKCRNIITHTHLCLFFGRGFIAFIRYSEASSISLKWLKPLVYSIPDKSLLAYHFEGDGWELKKNNKNINTHTERIEKKISLLHRFYLTFWVWAHLAVLSTVKAFDKVSTGKTWS